MANYRLVYLWIDKYKNIEKKPIRFTLDYDVGFDEAVNTICITRTSFADATKHRWNPLKILDAFCSLIGVNGAGKTNALELLEFLMTQYTFPAKAAKSYLVLEFVDDNGNLVLEVISHETYSFSVNKDEVQSSINKASEPEKLPKVLTYTPLPIDDLPFKQHQFHRQLIKIKSRPLESSAGPFSSYAKVPDHKQRRDELAERCQVIPQKLKRMKLTENSKARLLIQLNHGWLIKPYFERVIEIERYSNEAQAVLAEVIGLPALVSDYKKRFDIIEDAKSYFLHRYVFELASHFIVQLERHVKVRFIEDTGGGYSQVKDERKSHCIFILGLTCLDINLPPVVLSYLQKYMQSYVEGFEAFFKQHWLDYLVPIKPYFINEELNGYAIAIPLAADIDMSALWYLVTPSHLPPRVYNTGEPFDFDGNQLGLTLKIEGLSSGETNVINFFGELIEILSDNDNQHCLILLDEAEQTFHPEWQRLFVGQLCDVFARHNTQAQVVLASHSPFMLSDMLNDKVTTFTTDAEQPEPLNNTFAANIHELLSNRFFMDHTIGGMAADAVMSVVEFINNQVKEERQLPGNSLEEKIKAAQMIIDQVSDSLLKRELGQRLTSVVRDQSEQFELAALFEKAKDDKALAQQLITLGNKVGRDQL